MEKILKRFFVALPHLDVTRRATPSHKRMSEKGDPENITVNKT